MITPRQFLTPLFVTLLLVGVWFFPSLRQVIEDPTQSQLNELVLFEGTTMTMPYRISVEAPVNPSKRQACQAAIDKVFHRIDTIFNRWNPHSQLSSFNSSLSTQPFSIEPDLFAMLQKVDEIWKLSRGGYDPTISSLTQLWKKYLSQGLVPPQSMIDEVSTHVGWFHIQLLAPNRIKKDHPLVQIDLSSIAKGYAVDQICQALTQLGFKHIFVEWAGEVKVRGGHPSHRDWIVGIKTPRKYDYSFLGKIEIKDGSIATSGHDELFWVAREENGVMHTYSHLMNPLTKKPLYIEQRMILSCTIIAPNCDMADALATTGLLFDNIEEAKTWAKEVVLKWPHMSVFFFTKDQQLWHFTSKNSNSHHVVETIELYLPLIV